MPRVVEVGGMRNKSSFHRVALAAITCGVLIAACGSSGNPSSSSGKPGGSLRGDAGLAFSRCMRSHGVTNFPDPATGGGGVRIQIGPSTGINPFSPAFKAAQASCGKLLPGGGPGSGHPSAQARAAMLQISECMRQHGISAFPDPTLSPPSSPAGYSAVLGRGGVFLAIPSTINSRSPAFTQAARACKFPG
jgi:hypothetical protein